MEDASTVIERLKSLFAGAKLIRASRSIHELTFVFDNGLQIIVTGDESCGFAAPLDIDITQVTDTPTGHTS